MRPPQLNHIYYNVSTSDVLKSLMRKVRGRTLDSIELNPKDRLDYFYPTQNNIYWLFRRQAEPLVKVASYLGESND